MPEPILSVQDLVKHYPIRKGVFRRQVGSIKAVDGVSFDLMPGETAGSGQESGCGKSTVARTLLRLIEPTAGRAKGTDIFLVGQGRHARVAAAYPDHLPGPVRLAQPADDGG